jgi:hypothetical protein
MSSSGIRHNLQSHSTEPDVIVNHITSVIYSQDCTGFAIYYAMCRVVAHSIGTTVPGMQIDRHVSVVAPTVGFRRLVVWHSTPCGRGSTTGPKISQQQLQNLKIHPTTRPCACSNVATPANIAHFIRLASNITNNRWRICLGLPRLSFSATQSRLRNSDVVNA